ncbi:MAG: formate dehydrogenase accessory sulfurtransferase FdhD [Desulfobacteraceae bacterium]|jgi:FdhD protein
MSATAPLFQEKITSWNTRLSQNNHQSLIREEPLSIRIQGKPYSVVMRTPGNEIAHAAGFCLAEGIVDTSNDIKNIAYCDGEESNVVTVTLTPERYAKVVVSHLDRRAYISQTSCGLCGKELVSEIQQAIYPIKTNFKVSVTKIIKCIRALPSIQPLRQQTGATHATAIYDENFSLLASAEDVGRHNALDKTMGQLFLENRLSQTALLILSSRISYEMVQKAARAGTAIIVAYSRPTELAVKLAESLNITLACLTKDGGMLIFCHPKRLLT